MFSLNRRDVIIVLALLVAALLPRMVDLGVFLTADEKNWIGRSYEFVRAFKDWRFNDMMQTTHPGVTTMWLVGGAVTARMLLSHIPFSFQNLSHFVTAAQFPIALLNAVMVPLIYLLLRRLFPQSVLLPTLAAAILALDSFMVGYSRVAHVDALLAGFLFAAALATIIYAWQGYNRRWLLVAAVLAGLAILTKAPAIFIVPFFWLTVLVREGRQLLTRTILVERLRDFALWLLVAGLLVALLWPAILWVPNPQGNVLTVKRDLSIAALTPHHMVEDYSLEGSHYLFTLLTRTTPVTLTFSIVGIVWLLFQANPLASGVKRKMQNNVLWLVVAYVFFFVLMMTIGAKKGDRYILPVFPAIDALAAFGVIAAGNWLRGLVKNFQFSIFNFQKHITALLALLVVICLGVTVYRYHPYAIAYSNPLFPDNLSQELGWGEGLEQVGAWLTEHDGDARVASWYPEELGAYTSAAVSHINAHEQPRIHYVVLYRNMFGRPIDHPANDFIDLYYKKLTPVFIAHVAGKEFAWVYERETYERVAGEFVAGLRAGQELIVPNNATQLEVMIATYSGRAKRGEVVVSMHRSQGGTKLHEWRKSVAEINDNQWVGFDIPEGIVAAGDTVLVEISAEGTVVNDAPTARYSTDYDYRPGNFVLNGENKTGDLAVRFQ